MSSDVKRRELPTASAFSIELYKRVSSIVVVAAAAVDVVEPRRGVGAKTGDAAWREARQRALFGVTRDHATAGRRSTRRAAFFLPSTSRSKR